MEGGERGKEKKSNVWFSLKRSLHCKAEPSDVHDPKSSKKNQNPLHSVVPNSRVGIRSGCSRSIANLRDVIHGSRRHNLIETSQLCSPTPSSIASSEFHNPITHDVILRSSKCEVNVSNGGVGYPKMPTIVRNYSSMKTLILEKGRERSSALGVDSNLRKRFSIEAMGSNLSCHKCGEKFNTWDSLEAHHQSKHAVTELVECDSSRKIVEIICKTGYQKSENQSIRIERVLKVHNTQKTIAQFEEYREMGKIKASKLPKKHPRCLADGNELLRFYGTTVSCSLGLNGSSSLCGSEKCHVCRIIRHGFSSKKEVKGGIGVFTTSTSERAFQSIENNEDYDRCLRKALIVCRVIAGRVHRPLEKLQDLVGQTYGFDSLAGKFGLYSNIEELYLLNPRALLPCFVVICKS